jgi:RNA polymerase sigma-70 factor (sigma-E family)
MVSVLRGFTLSRAQRAWEKDFVAYYAAKGDMLRKTAFALCGDWHLAEDLTQTAFTNLYRVWNRIERHEVLDQYARRVLLRAFLDQGRRPWRREVPDSDQRLSMDLAGVEDTSAEDRLVLRAALLGLPKRRRAVLVLRFWADLSIEQVAEILQCPQGTVKSLTARGLADLRERLGDSLGPYGRPAASMKGGEAAMNGDVT